MHRVPNLVAIILVVSASEALAANLLVGPYLQNFSPHSIAIMWETDADVEGHVEWGETAELGDRNSGPSAATHEIVIDGLRPSTKYYYRAVWEGGESKITWFRTAPPLGERHFRFVAYGDSRSDPETHSAIIARALEMDPVFFLNSGDLVANGLNYKDWKPMFFDPIEPLAQNVCFYTVMGNHENNSDLYRSYMSLPKNGKYEAWWSTDIGNIHLVGLDSNTKYYDTQPGSEQYEWLKQDLASTTQEWKIVTFHHPAFSFHPTRDVSEVRWDWQPVLQEMGVDLVLVGHDHHYGRTFPIGPFTNEPAKGVVHITSGGGGAGLYPVHDFGYSANRRSVHNLVVFDVEGDRIVGRALDMHGRGIDSFVIDKRTPASPDTFVSYETIEIEKEISDKWKEEPATPIATGQSRIETGIGSQVVFGGTVTAEIRQLDQGSPWVVEADPPKQVLPPGTPFKANLVAEKDTSSGAIYPLPRVGVKIFSEPTLRELGAPTLGFKNTDFEISPFKVREDLRVRIPDFGNTIAVDGAVETGEWEGAAVVDRFLESTKGGAPKQPTKVHVFQDNSTGNLYVGAVVDRAHGDVGKQPYGSDRNDSYRLVANEHLRVLLSDGKSVWVFLVTANNLGLDLKDKEDKWGVEGFAYAAKPAEGGWTAEMAIPLAKLGVRLEGLRVNFGRFDLANSEDDEWSPTLGTWYESPAFYGVAE